MELDSPAHFRERQRTRRFFHRVAFAFRVIDRRLLRDYREALKRLDLPPGLEVLDLGTGTGTLALAFSERGHPVRGVDFVPRLLHRARHRMPAGDFRLLDLAELPQLPSSSADLVSLAYVLHGLDPDFRAFVLGEAARLTRRYVLVFDYSDGLGPWYVRLVERIEGPHYRDFVRRGMTGQLSHSGLEVVEHLETSTFGAAWLARPDGFERRPEVTPGHPRR